MHDGVGEHLRMCVLDAQGLMTLLLPHWRVDNAYYNIDN